MFGGIYGLKLVFSSTMDMLTLPILWRDIGNLSSTLPWEEELTYLMHTVIENYVPATYIGGIVIECTCRGKRYMTVVDSSLMLRGGCKCVRLRRFNVCIVMAWHWLQGALILTVVKKVGVFCHLLNKRNDLWVFLVLIIFEVFVD